MEEGGWTRQWGGGVWRVVDYLNRHRLLPPPATCRHHLLPCYHHPLPPRNGYCSTYMVSVLPPFPAAFFTPTPPLHTSCHHPTAYTLPHPICLCLSLPAHALPAPRACLPYHLPTTCLLPVVMVFCFHMLVIMEGGVTA